MQSPSTSSGMHTNMSLAGQALDPKAQSEGEINYKPIISPIQLDQFASPWHTQRKKESKLDLNLGPPTLKARFLALLGPKTENYSRKSSRYS